MLQFHRPFSWYNGQTRVYDPVEYASPHASSTPSAANQSKPSACTSTLPLSDMRVIGQINAEWALLHRKYNLFLFHMPPGETNAPISAAGLDLSAAQHAQVGAQASDIDAAQYVQFAYIKSNPRFHEFALRSSSHKLTGLVDRTGPSFSGALPNAGNYTLLMDAAESQAEASQSLTNSEPARAKMAHQYVLGGEKGEKGMTLDQRAVMLATAVAIDYDYFSLSSRRDELPNASVGKDPKAGGAVERAPKAAGAAGKRLDEPADHKYNLISDSIFYATVFPPLGYVKSSRQLPPPLGETSPQDPWGQRPAGPDAWGGLPERAGTSEPVWGEEGKDPWSDQAGQTGGGKFEAGSGGLDKGGPDTDTLTGLLDLML